MPHYKTNLGDGMRLYVASMGKIFRVTHVCDSTEEANDVMMKNRDTAMIAEDERGRVYLAEQYGAKCPSALLNIPLPDPVHA